MAVVIIDCIALHIGNRVVALGRVDVRDEVGVAQVDAGVNDAHDGTAGSQEVGQGREKVFLPRINSVHTCARARAKYGQRVGCISKSMSASA